MKIEIKDRGQKEYYDEFLYVSTNMSRIKNNPYMKVGSATKIALIYSIISFICGILFSLIYYFNRSTLYLIVLILFGILFIFSLFYIFLINKTIKGYLNSEGIIDFIINEDGIEISKDDYKVNEKWDDIELIVINKYSICFIPKYPSKLLISISNDYKKDVVKGLKEVKKNSLIVDNIESY